MKHWESYALGAIGISIAVPSLAAQVVLIADDVPGRARFLPVRFG